MDMENTLRTKKNILRQRSLTGFFLLLFTNPVLCEIWIRGKGASFPSEVYKNWMPLYQAHRSAHVNVKMSYDAIGSGNGKTAIKENIDIEYAGSDSLLSEQDEKDYPDLVMFPSMAGGVVVGYNLPIPGLDNGQLRLSREHLVGIYNGTLTWWNDSSIQAINPGHTMPEEEIIVIARADKSGTTSLFTEALSVFDSNWNETYGVFSKGLDSLTDLPFEWKKGVIHFFGQQNRGVSGLIMSLKYSVGYISVADTGHVSAAQLLNKAGKYVNVSTQTVQSAIDYYSRRGSSLKLSLADASSDDAYPIAGFTYFIVYKTQMKRCDSAKEFVRYVDYVLTEKTTNEICETLGMAPLSVFMTNRIRSEILKTISCDNQNVWNMVESDKARETAVEQTWIIPVCTTISIVGLLIILVFIYVMRQRLKILQMLNKSEWYIPIEDIVFVSDEKNKSSSNGSKLFGRSMLSFTSSKEHSVDDVIIQQILQWPGKWRGVQIGIRLMQLKHLKTLNMQMKQYLLSMKTRISHGNIVRFFGLTDLDSDMYVVGEYCAKGSVKDIIQDGKFNLTNDFKISLSFDIASGLQYLHSNEILHGHLRSNVCLVDARWQVKIGDWEFCKLLAVKRGIPTKMFELNETLEKAVVINNLTIDHFWTAPEVLRSDFMAIVTKECDVYSFAITIQEIFSREDPYIEHVSSLSPKDVINAVLSNGLRPEHTEDTSMSMRQIMEICWSDNPVSRPTFDQIIKLLRRAHPMKKTIIDSMMATMEEYILHLEQRIEENDDEMQVIRNKLESNFSSLMPSENVIRLLNGNSIAPEHHRCLAVAVIEVGPCNGDVEDLTPSEIVTLMNEIYSETETLAGKYSIFLQKISGCTLFLVGGFEFQKLPIQEMCLSFITLCFEIITNEDILQSMKTMNSSLYIKIGAHIGEATTGIIQTKSPSYVVIGSVVDVAQALARSCPIDGIHVSQKMWKMLKKRNKFSGSVNGRLVVRDHQITTYTLTQSTNTTVKSDDSGVGGESNIDASDLKLKLQSHLAETEKFQVENERKQTSENKSSRLAYIKRSKSKRHKSDGDLNRYNVTSEGTVAIQRHIRPFKQNGATRSMRNRSYNDIFDSNNIDQIPTVFRKQKKSCDHHIKSMANGLGNLPIHEQEESPEHSFIDSSLPLTTNACAQTASSTSEFSNDASLFIASEYKRKDIDDALVQRQTHSTNSDAEPGSSHTVHDTSASSTSNVMKEKHDIPISKKFVPVQCKWKRKYTNAIHPSNASNK